MERRTLDTPETTEDLQSQIISTTVPIISTIETTKKERLNEKNNQDPFEPPKLSLLITSSLVNQSEARILIDTGAVLDYIDSEFCRKNGIITETTEHMARMANKTTQPLTVTKEPIEIQMKGYTDQRKLTVCPLDYDIILGKKWTTEKECVIGCATNEITFKHKHRSYTLEATEPSIVHSVSASSIVNDEKRQFPVYALLVRDMSGIDNTDVNGTTDPRIRKSWKITKMFFQRNFHRDYLQNGIVNSILS